MDDAVATLVRDADRDRWLANLYAPAILRPALLALHALDLELAKVAATTTDAMLGQIRLAWWRERLEGLDRGEVPAQPVLQALAADVLPRGVSGAMLAGFEDAWLPVVGAPPDSHEMLMMHVVRRGAELFGALAVVGGGERMAGVEFGVRWAAGEAARAGWGEVAFDAATRAPGPLRPLAGLAALGRRDCARAAAGLPPEPRATAARQWLLLRAALIGR